MINDYEIAEQLELDKEAEQGYEENAYQSASGDTTYVQTY